MKRRTFIKNAAVIAAAASGADILNAAEALQPVEIKAVPAEESAESVQEAPASGKLIASAPMLQNFAETSIGITFAVNALANGYVLISEHPNMADAVKVKCGGYRVTAIDDRVIQVRVTGLKASTRYFYRIGADRIHYGGGYDMKILGNEEDSRVFSFVTAGPGTKASFCVINDTHVQWATISRLMDKIAGIAPSCVVWNGDASNVEETVEAQVKIFLDPQMERKDYAASIPYLFCPGNHDSRGWANRHLEHVWMFRQPEERSSRDWDLGRNFAVRMGDIAMIGLDTAEDKLDTNPRFAGLFNSADYREAQAVWLQEVLKKKEIARAPYLVAFCHIPLFDPRPDMNPGDIAPADTAPEYKHDFAIWQRTCGNLWGPLLNKAGCQLVITAHQHQYRFDAPGEGRKWAQIVGGGTSLSGPDYATVIDGRVDGNRLVIDVHNIRTGAIEATHTFKPRR